MLPNTVEDIARQLADLQRSTERLEHQRSGANRLIDSAVLAAPAALVTFATIPNIYDHLIILYQARSSNAATLVHLMLQLNGDVGNNYDWQMLSAFAANVNANEFTGVSGIGIGSICAAGATADHAGTGVGEIPNYKGTIFEKDALGRSYAKYGGAAALRLRSFGGHWHNNVAITSITLFAAAGNLITGSRFDLYGVQGGP